MIPKDKDFDTRFEDDVAELKDKTRTDKDKYQTIREQKERQDKETKNKKGNKSTELDDEWS